MKTMGMLVTIACAAWIVGATAQAQQRAGRDLSELRVQSYKAVSVDAAGREGHQTAVSGQADCRKDCQDQVDQMFQGCVEVGGEPAECEAQAGMTYWQCLQDQCEMELPGSPCDFQCHQRAGYVYDDCIDQGGTPEECGTHGEQAFRDCLVNECGREPEPPQCGAVCHEEAVQIFSDCMTAGGTEEDCRAEALEYLEACTAACGSGPQGPSCESVCRQDAEQFYNDCVDGGGLPEECADLAQESLRECLMVECGHEFPAQDTCVSGCHEDAYEMYHACREDGGTKEECRDAAVLFLNDCLSGCP